MCPGDLLGIVESLVGCGDPASCVDRALSIRTNVERDVSNHFGSFPAGAGVPRGTGCWGCGYWRWPPTACCTVCTTPGGLAILGLTNDQAAWLTGFGGLLDRYPGLRCLRLVGGLRMLVFFQCILAWVRHVHSRSHRWTSHCWPSAPLLGRTAVLCIWRVSSIDSDTCPPAPPGSRWRYLLQGPAWVLSATPLLPPSPSPGPYLLSTACSICGLPRGLWALLDVPGDWTAAVEGSGGPCCWRCHSEDALLSSMAARSAVPFGPICLNGVLPTSLLRRWACEVPSEAAPLPYSAAAYAAAHLFDGVEERLQSASVFGTDALRVATITLRSPATGFPLPLQLTILLSYRWGRTFIVFGQHWVPLWNRLHSRSLLGSEGFRGFPRCIGAFDPSVAHGSALVSGCRT